MADETKIFSDDLKNPTGTENIVLSSGVNVLNSVSGINNLGAAANPFDTIYVNNIVPAVSGAGGSGLPTTGGTMTGDITFNSASIVDSTSLVDSSEKSIAFGTNNVASGTNSQAFGNGTKALSDYSHAEGFQTYVDSAAATAAHAEGYQAYVYSLGAHVEGYQTSSSGLAAHAEGYQTNTYGQGSHAEGNVTKAYGAYSHAEGQGTVSSGNHSHSGGKDAVSQGEASFTHGRKVQTAFSGSFFLGDYQDVVSVNDVADSMRLRFQNGVTLHSGTNFLTIESGVANIGSVANPFSGVHTNNINSAQVTLTMFMEEPAGDVDGINTLFNLTNEPFGDSLLFYQNGLLMLASGTHSTTFDYSLAGSGLTFETAPPSGATLIAGSYGYLG